MVDVEDDLLPMPLKGRSALAPLCCEPFINASKASLPNSLLRTIKDFNPHCIAFKILANSLSLSRDSGRVKDVSLVHRGVPFVAVEK